MNLNELFKFLHFLVYSKNVKTLSISNIVGKLLFAHSNKYE